MQYKCQISENSVHLFMNQLLIALGWFCDNYEMLTYSHCSPYNKSFHIFALQWECIRATVDNETSICFDNVRFIQFAWAMPMIFDLENANKSLLIWNYASSSSDRSRVYIFY